MVSEDYVTMYNLCGQSLSVLGATNVVVVATARDITHVRIALVHECWFVDLQIPHL